MPPQGGQVEQPTALARWTLAAAGAATALAVLLIYLSSGAPLWQRLGLRAAELGLLGVFVADRVRRLLRARRTGLFLREHAMDLALLALAAAAVLAGLGSAGRFLPAVGMYVLLSRCWMLLPRRRLLAGLNVLLALTGMVAVAALVLEYGFGEPRPVRREVLHAVQTVVVAMFILDRVVRLESSRLRWAYLRENWVDFALMVLAGGVVAIGQRLQGQVLSAGTVYVIITQAYILISLVMRAVSVNLDFAGSGVHPTWLLIGSFAAMCLAGSGLLMLPAATPADHPISYPDALFTATSATCVTGLIVRDTGTEFTPFGQGVILALIQLGGLGIMLFGTVLALLVGKGLSVRSSDALGQMIGTQGIGRLTRVAKFVVAVTLGMELLGAVLLYPMFASPQGPHVPTAASAAWNSVFHSISSFCNAGFALYGHNMMQGVREGWSRPLRAHWQILGVMAPLIVLGGLGFPVIQDCARYVKALLSRAMRRAKQRRVVCLDLPRPRLSLHSKIVLTSTLVLIVLGAGGLLLFGRPRGATPIGRNPITGPASGGEGHSARWGVGAALFQSITARTAGFNTIDMQEDLSDAGRLWICGLMVIGGSPASTAGGMKTATLAVLVLTAWSMVKRRSEVEAFGRSISAELLRKTVTLAVLYLALVSLVTLGLLCVEMSGKTFMSAFFEACSACGTVGLSTGITPAQNSEVPAKLVIIAGMFAGRLGPLTLLLAATIKMRHVRYAYPTEDVVIG